MSKTYHTNIVASYLVLQKGDTVLLLRRCNTGYQDGMFSLIAGHVEAGENFTDAIIREANEEAGIEVSRDHLAVRHIMHRKSDADQSERVDVFLVATAWKGEIQNLEPEKCSELTWFPLTELPEQTIPYVRQALENISRNSAYSERGW